MIKNSMKTIEISLILTFLIISISYSQKDTILKTNNDIKNLEYKVDVLKDANDKIINVVYFSIGTVLTILIGLGIWNNISSRNLNNRKIEQLEKELILKNEELIKKTISDKLDYAISSRTSNLTCSIDNLSKQILGVEIEQLKNKIELYPKYSDKPDLYDILKLIRLSKDYTLVYEPILHSTLDFLKNYIENEEVISSSDVTRIKDELSKLPDKYDSQRNVIVKLIERT